MGLGLKTRKLGAEENGLKKMGKTNFRPVFFSPLFWTSGMQYAL
jgi:hypothetical protein